MNPSEFTHWLRGLLDRDGALTAEQIKKVQEKLASVVPDVRPAQVVPAVNPWPVQPWYGGIGVVCGGAVPVAPNMKWATCNVQGGVSVLQFGTAIVGAGALPGNS